MAAHISLCTCAPSPKCLDGSTPNVHRSCHHNVMEIKPGVKIKSAFSAACCIPAVHMNPPDLVQTLKFAALKFPRKPFETFSKDCHSAFSLSFNAA